MKLYKLTDRNFQTRGQIQWGENVTHTASGSENKLCSTSFIHAYEHPLIAAFMNPAHSNFKHPVLWEAEGNIALRDFDLKCGCKSLITIRRIPLPVITTKQRIAIAIHSAYSVCKNRSFKAWANAWLSNKNRTSYAAYAAVYAAYGAAAYDAAAYAAYAAAYDAHYGTYAVSYAAYATVHASRYSAAYDATFKVLPYILKIRRN